MASSSEISAQPVEFTKVGHITGKGLDDVFIWYPIAPPGYASVGCVVSRTDKPPQADIVCCPRLDLLNPGNIMESPILTSESSKSSHWSIWKVENQVKVKRKPKACSTLIFCPYRVNFMLYSGVLAPYLMTLHFEYCFAGWHILCSR